MSEPLKKEGGSGVYGRDQVVKIINSVLNKVEHAHAEDARDMMYIELKALQKIIEDARKEVGVTKPADIKDKHIPTATDELDAVVAATAEATGTIMDCCDVIQQKAGEIGGDNGAALEGEVTKIYEACSFQDITGQRITKVVTTLKTIEGKVEKLLSVIGDKMPGMDHGSAEEETGKTGDAALLNGPQMPDKAITQADIDKLLSEFD